MSVDNMTGVRGRRRTSSVSDPLLIIVLHCGSVIMERVPMSKRLVVNY